MQKIFKLDFACGHSRETRTAFPVNEPRDRWVDQDAWCNVCNRQIKVLRFEPVSSVGFPASIFVSTKTTLFDWDKLEAALMQDEIEKKECLSRLDEDREEFRFGREKGK